MINMDFQNSIFESKEWLNCIVPGLWKEVNIKKGEEFIARLPFVYKTNRIGMKFISNPTFNQYTGPWIKPMEGNNYRKISNQITLIKEILDELPPYDYLKLNLHPSIFNAYGLIWNKITATLRYTYCFDFRNKDYSLVQGFERNIRNDIKKAISGLNIIKSNKLDVDEFLLIHKDVFLKQGIPYPYDHKIISKFADFFNSINRLKIYKALDTAGEVANIIVLIEDYDTIHYVFGATNQKFKALGGSSFLLSQAINDARDLNLNFNFYGSMNPNIERYFRSFGADCLQYFNIEKFSKRYKRLINLKGICGR